MQPSENPYESPRTESGFSPADGQYVFKLRFWPRDKIDYAVMSVACVIGFVCGIAMVIYLRESIGALLAIAGILSVVLGMLLRLNVQHVTATESGLHLGRQWGASRFVEWRDIEGIRRASRREYLFVSYFKPRHTSPLCMTYRDHFRIDWRGGYFYFPPEEPEVFVETIESYLDRERSKP